MNTRQKSDMENVLIAYNNAGGVVLHDFFESCAMAIADCCAEIGHAYSLVSPPHLDAEHVVGVMDRYSICMVASHGDSDGVYNEKLDEVVTIHTINYNLNGKVFYAISCNCAQNLLPHLRTIGVDTFVGYDDNLIVKESIPYFKEAAVTGLISLLQGSTKEEAHKRMYDKYTEGINAVTDKEAKRFLLHDREHLCFE